MQRMTIPQVNKVGIYCRLSREDGDSFESSSIQSQKEMLTDFALNQNWSIYDYYVDDGYSGTSFDRPAFKRMIEDCELKKINIIITKDLSRLGRNYLDTGRYTEEYFPTHNIRYIAVNDNYDTLDANANDFAPFKNIINEWYAKDISKKVRSTFQIRYNKGVIPSAVVPIYGYKFIEGTTSRIIDPEVVENVKLIFEMYIEGYPIRQICNKLIERKQYFPGYYLYTKYGWYKDKYSSLNEEEAIKWRPEHVYRILEKRIEYAGTLVLGKTNKISFKLKKRVKRTVEQCKKIEDAYEAIISKEVLARIEAIMLSRSKSVLPLEVNPFKDLLFCKNCGSILRYRNLKSGEGYIPRYVCRCEKCKSKANIRFDAIKVIIENEIKALYSKIVPYKEKFLEVAAGFCANKDEHRNTKAEIDITSEIEKNTRRLRELEDLIQKLFESRVSDDIPQIIYERMMKKYKDEVASINIKLEELSKLTIKKDKSVNYFKLANEFYERLVNVDINQISRKNMLELFESITVERVNNKEYKVHLRINFVPSLVEVYLDEVNK